MGKPCPYCEGGISNSDIGLAIVVGHPIYCTNCKMRVHLRSPSIFSFIASQQAGVAIYVPLVIAVFIYKTVVPLVIGLVLMLCISFIYRYSAGFVNAGNDS